MPSDRLQCTATSKRSGERCKKPPMRGAKTCLAHGSGTVRARAAAKRRKDSAASKAAMAAWGRPVVIDPIDGVLQEVHRTAGHIAWLEAQIRLLGDGDLMFGLTRIKEGGEDYGRTYEAKPNAWLVEYNAQRKHFLEACKVALNAGYDERRVRIAEAQGAVLAGVVHAILSDLHLTAEQQVLVGEVVPRHMLAVDAGGGA